MTNFQWIPAVHRLYAVVLFVRSCSSAQYHYIRLCQIHNSDLICKVEKTENIHQVFYQNFEKWTKSVQGLISGESSSNQKSNSRELQYMSILLALAYHDRATFETFRKLELLHQKPLNSFFWSNMVGGSITLCLPTEATKGFMYSFGSALQLVTDLNWKQAI